MKDCGGVQAGFRKEDRRQHNCTKSRDQFIQLHACCIARMSWYPVWRAFWSMSNRYVAVDYGYWKSAAAAWGAEKGESYSQLFSNDGGHLWRLSEGRRKGKLSVLLALRLCPCTVNNILQGLNTILHWIARPKQVEVGTMHDARAVSGKNELPKQGRSAKRGWKTGQREISVLWAHCLSAGVGLFLCCTHQSLLRAQQRCVA
ncbi:hypothetical protein V8E36_005803 [Tilletia maclaganii]